MTLQGCLFSHNYRSTFAPGDDTDPRQLYEQDARVSLLWKPSSHRGANVSLTGRFSLRETRHRCNYRPARAWQDGTKLPTQTH